MKLGKHINHLLYRYDCVIVPDFGGFVGNYSAARINPVQHQFYPPGKSITFNRHLRNNDGLLANLIAQRKGCSFEEAMKLLNKEVRKMEGKLKSGERVTLDQIGTFQLDAANNLLFEPLLHSNFLLDSFGLTNFQALPVKNDTSDQESETKVIPINRNRNLSRIVKIAAAAVLVFSMVWVPLKTDFIEKAGLDKAFDNILNRTPAAYSIQDSEVEASVIRENDPDFLRNILKNSDSPMAWSFLSADERAAETPPAIKIVGVVKGSAKSQSIFSGYGAYQIVGGCFAQKENAEHFVSRLRKRGYSAAITGMRHNLHVVAYGTYEKRTDALKMLRIIQSEENSQAWLLKN